MNSIICPYCNIRHKYKSDKVQKAIGLLIEAPGDILIECECGHTLTLRFFYAPAIMLLNPLDVNYNPETAIWNT